MPPFDSSDPRVPASSTSKPSRLWAWASLVRLPNVFTVVADITAAFLLVAGSPFPLARLALVVTGGVLVYWAGMILNDVFDREIDVKERPERPIPSGQIPVPIAARAGLTCLFAGGVIASAAGFVPDAHFATTWLPAAVVTILIALVVLYDGPLKRTPVAPMFMGGCRSMSFLLGAAVVTEPNQWKYGFPPYLLAIALGFGLYIMGLTTIGRKEACSDRQQPANGKQPAENSAYINTGTMLTIIGLVVLAMAPTIQTAPMGWMVDTKLIFPLSVALVAYRVVLSAIRVARDPVPTKIQATVRNGILAIIPLAACFAVLGSGWWGIGVFALVVPSLALAQKFRVT